MENHLTLGGDYLGQPVVLRPFQREIIETIFGQFDEDGNRLINKAFISMGRKGAKTYLIALIVLYVMVYLPKADQEIYSIAWTKEQAAQLFNYIYVIVMSNAWLRDRCEINRQMKQIIFTPKMNKFRALPGNPAITQGLNPSVCVVDELHVFKGPKGDLLYDGLTSGMGARKDPLEIVITTAGADPSPSNLCYTEYCYAKKVISGEVKNENYAAWIWEAPPEAHDDPFNEEYWYKAMPALGDFTSLKFIRKEAAKAKKIPRKLNEFKQKYLNLWVDSAFAWIPTESWSQCKWKCDPEDHSTYDENGTATYTPDDLIGSQCFVGFDWGSVRDLTAMTLLFPQDGGTFKVLSYCWIPRGTAAERALQEDTRYAKWIEKGFVRTTEGNATDYKQVKQEVLDILKQYQVRLFAADPTSCGEFLEWLKRAGVKTYPVRQSDIGLISAGAKNLESMILNKTLFHHGDPVLNWCMQNALIKVDFYENIRPMKSSETGRIDPVVCLVFATAVATVILDQTPVTLQMYN